MLPRAKTSGWERPLRPITSCWCRERWKRDSGLNRRYTHGARRTTRWNRELEVSCLCSPPPLPAVPGRSFRLRLRSPYGRSETGGNPRQRPRTSRFGDRAGPDCPPSCRRLLSSGRYQRPGRGLRVGRQDECAASYRSRTRLSPVVPGLRRAGYPSRAAPAFLLETICFSLPLPRPARPVLA